MGYIAILENIIFAFQTHFTSIFRSRFAAIIYIIIVCYNFSANKTFFKV